MTDPWRAPDADGPWAPPRRGTTGPSRVEPRDFWAPDPEPDPAGPSGWVRLALATWEHQLTFLACSAGVLLVGAPLGLLWARLTPRIGVTETPDGLQLTSPEGSTFFAVEGWFVLLSVVAGVVTAAVAWRALRGRGPAVSLGLVTGALLGARVAHEVGSRVVVDERVHRFCTAPGAECVLYDGRLQVRGSAAFLVWALSAVVLHLLLVTILDREPAPPPVAGWSWPDALAEGPDPDRAGDAP